MKLKKVLSLILCVAMVLSTMSFAVSADEVSVWDGTSYDIEWCKAEHTSAGAAGGQTYYIKTAEELAGLAHIINTWYTITGEKAWDDYRSNNAFTGDTIILEKDIDLAGFEWTPIGTFTSDKNHFYGSFDGQNHTISNLKISESSGQIYGGLFGRFKSTKFSQTFSNLTINNVDITTVAAADGKEGTGALMGYGYDQIIDNVHVTGNIAMDGNSCIGGIAGQSRAYISNSSVEAEGTVSGDYRVGGLVGWFISASANGYNAEINGCSVDGDGAGITIESGNSNAGGLVGRVNNNDGTVAIDDVRVSNAAVEVSGENAGVGAYVVPGFESVTNATVANVTVSLNGEAATPSDSENVSLAVAEVDGEYYLSLTEALKAIQAGSVVNLLKDETISGKWDCRYTGSKTTVPYTFNGNGHTLKFTGAIDDGGNHLTVFRPEAEAKFMNLTVDMSEAISVFQNRFTVISSKDADLTVTNCNFIGSETYTAARAVMVGESAGHNDAEVVVSKCTFKNFRYGVTDNLNGKEVASVTVTDSEFDNASINVSASEEATITGNDVEGGFVKVVSYTPDSDLVATVTGNTLDENYASDNVIKNAAVINAQGNIANAGVAAELNGVNYTSLKKAIAAAEAAGLTDVEINVFKDFNVKDIPTTISKVTFVGNDDVTMTIGNQRLENFNHGTYVFKDINVDAQSQWTYLGLLNINMEYQSCVINGCMTLWFDSAKFVDCVFNGIADEYSIFNYACKDVTIENCVFNSVDKAIKIYNEGAETLNNSTMSITNSEFFASATEDVKAVVEINFEHADYAPVVDLDIEDSFALGFAEGEASENVWYNLELKNGVTAGNAIDVEYETSTAYQCGDISVALDKVEDGLYNIVLNAADGADIYQFVAAEFVFENLSTTLTGATMNYEVSGNSANGTVAQKAIKNDKERYIINLADGEKRLTGSTMIIGQVKFIGQGTIDFKITEGEVDTTEYNTNLGKYYVGTAATGDVDTLDISAAAINTGVSEITRNVTINVAYNHPLVKDVWSDDKITVTLKDYFGNEFTDDITDGIATFTNVSLGRITVTLEAPGFRKFVYNTTLDADDAEIVVLNFWNDVKVESKKEAIEAGTEKVAYNFVVGDIVMDYIVDKYDLAAVTSYYGMYNIENNSKFLMYDLNRDGNIDIRDVQYVLHTMGN